MATKKTNTAAVKKLAAAKVTQSKEYVVVRNFYDLERDKTLMHKDDPYDVKGLKADRIKTLLNAGVIKEK